MVVRRMYSRRYSSDSTACGMDSSTHSPSMRPANASALLKRKLTLVNKAGRTRVGTTHPMILRAICKPRTSTSSSRLRWGVRNRPGHQVANSAACVAGTSTYAQKVEFQVRVLEWVI